MNIENSTKLFKQLNYKGFKMSHNKLHLQRLKQFINKTPVNIHYLKQDGVLEWVLGDKDWIKNMSKKEEDEWGKRVSQNYSVQWTTTLGEGVLFEILTLHNKNPRTIERGTKGANGKSLKPDFEADDGIYENKARKYYTTGTAGEKILGTPVKYCECSKLFKKPLYIVCMAYQEKEADEVFGLYGKHSSKELQNILEYYYNEYQVSYLKASDLLKNLV